MVQATTVFTNNSPRTVTHIKKSDWEQIVILSYGKTKSSGGWCSLTRILVNLLLR
ncbi:uncharacterized protein LOC141892769 isoform X3 [Acropora palmata]